MSLHSVQEEVMEKLEDEFCVMFERADRENAESASYWSERLEQFILFTTAKTYEAGKSEEKTEISNAVKSLNLVVARNHEDKDIVNMASFALKNYEDENKSKYIHELRGKVIEAYESGIKDSLVCGVSNHAYNQGVKDALAALPVEKLLKGSEGSVRMVFTGWNNFREEARAAITALLDNK